MNQFTASLWRDEAFSAILAKKPVQGIVSIVIRDTSPPFYYLLLHIWMKIFGDSETVIRSLSFLFFLFTVFFAYLIGKELFSKKEAISAAFLTLVNPFLFGFALEGRMYSLLVLCCTASTYFYLKKSWIWYIIWATAALYTHHFAIFIIAIQGIWFVAGLLTRQKLKELKKNLLSFISIGGLYLLWIPILFKQTSLVQSGFWLSKPSLKSIADSFLSYVVGGQADSIFLKFILILIFIALLMRVWKQQIKETLFLVLWIAFPVGSAFIISLIGPPIFYGRYLLIIVPGIMLLLSSNHRKIKNFPISMMVILIMVLLLGYQDLQFFLHPNNREPFSKLAAYVKIYQNKEVGLINLGSTHIFESKYYKLKAPIYLSGEDPPFYIGTALLEKNDTIRELPNKKIILAITDMNENDISLPNYQYFKTEKFNNLKVLWYKRVY